MAAESICDNCGKRAPMVAGRAGRWHKPRAWYERSDDDGIQTAWNTREAAEAAKKGGSK